KITEGGGTSRPLARPARTASSQPIAAATGMMRPSIGRDQRIRRSRDALRCSGVTCPAAMVMGIKDIPTPDATQGFSSSPWRGGTVTKPLRSIRERRLGVDQIVDRLLDVDVSLDDPRLLQCHSGLQDRVALVVPDLVVVQVGALLELNVGDGVRQLGGR